MASAPSSSPPQTASDQCQSQYSSLKSRIESLPLWDDGSSPNQSFVGDSHGPLFLYTILGIDTVTPVHPTLRYLHSKGARFHCNHYGGADNPKTSPQWQLPKDQVLRTIMDVLTGSSSDLQSSDYAYILCIMDQALSSQQQFWQFLAPIVRRTITKENKDSQFWKIRLAKYITPIYRAHGRSSFVQQLTRLASDAAQDDMTRCTTVVNEEEITKKLPLITDQHILGKLMVESLMYPTNDDKEASLLFEMLSETGQVRFHKDLFGMLVKRATLSYNSAQITLLGEMMLRHERLFTQSKMLTRPIQIHKSYMDNYLLKACELGLEDLARDIFKASLAAGRCQRASSFNIILNSYSTKQFGPKMVPKTAQALRRRRKGGKEDDTKSKHIGNNISTIQERLTALRLGRLDNKWTITTLEPVDELVGEMERLGIAPDMGTLNILVKLYLEVELQGIQESRPWQQVFTRYNPLDLHPDTVTCNTLLAFYERKRDLAMMRTIYESMTTAEIVELTAKTRRQRRREARELDQQLSQPAKKEEEEEEEKKIVPSFIKSQRDVYTYNTMLHALLQHAKDPKDVAAIGQVFYDMEQDGIPADTVTFNTNIMFHIRRGDFVAAMQVYQDMLESEPVTADKGVAAFKDRSAQRRRTIKRSLPTWAANKSSALGVPSETTTPDSPSALSIPKSPRIATALVPIPPTRDAATYTSLMSGYGQSNQMEIATFFFSEMVRLGLEPNFKTYSTLVAGLERAGDFQRAKTLWDMVLKDGQLTAKERKLVEALRSSSNKQP